MTAIGVDLIGRFGNQLFQYAYARALADSRGMPLRTNWWIGETIFYLQHERLRGDEEKVQGYFQDQKSMIYTREQAQNWFRFRRWVQGALRQECGWVHPVVAHHRKGDYADCGYVVVSKEATRRAATAAGFDADGIHWVSEETARTSGALGAELSFLMDFYTMMQAPVLFRSNSTFSWWAAVLGNGRVFAPVIEGLKGGTEHEEVRFVEGNWPRFCELDFVTDLRMKDEA